MLKFYPSVDVKPALLSSSCVCEGGQSLVSGQVHKSIRVRVSQSVSQSVVRLERTSAVNPSLELRVQTVEVDLTHHWWFTYISSVSCLFLRNSSNSILGRNYLCSWWKSKYISFEFFGLRLKLNKHSTCLFNLCQVQSLNNCVQAHSNSKQAKM